MREISKEKRESSVLGLIISNTNPIVPCYVSIPFQEHEENTPEEIPKEESDFCVPRFHVSNSSFVNVGPDSRTSLFRERENDTNLKGIIHGVTNAKLKTPGKNTIDIIFPSLDILPFYEGPDSRTNPFEEGEDDTILVNATKPRSDQQRTRSEPDQKETESDEKYVEPERPPPEPDDSTESRDQPRSARSSVNKQSPMPQPRSMAQPSSPCQRPIRPTQASSPIASSRAPVTQSMDLSL